MDERTGTYTGDDFVEVVDKETGKPLANPIPKAWLGTDLAPNVKKAGGRSGGGRQQSQGQQSGQQPSGPQEPAGNASRDDWAAYATKVKGATDADLVDEQGEPLGRDELRAKYGTPTS